MGCWKMLEIQYIPHVHKYMYNIISETIQLKIEWKELQQKVSIALENQNALYSITLWIKIICKCMNKINFSGQNGWMYYNNSYLIQLSLLA